MTRERYVIFCKWLVNWSYPNCSLAHCTGLRLPAWDRSLSRHAALLPFHEYCRHRHPPPSASWCSGTFPGFLVDAERAGQGRAASCLLEAPSGKPPACSPDPRGPLGRETPLLRPQCGSEGLPEQDLCAVDSSGRALAGRGMQVLVEGTESPRPGCGGSWCRLAQP